MFCLKSFKARINMAMTTKIEIIHKDIIKPSSPTPHDLKILKLSLLDQFTPITYTPLVLFYPINYAGDNLYQHVNTTEKSEKLKKSLSETLIHFYPLAGRIKDNTSIDCGDQGAEFIEVRMNCYLSEILKNPDAQILSQLLPAPIESPEAATGYLLLVQATFFDCGGLAVGICISHKMADAATLATFIRCWSATATCASEVQSPVFMGASIFPPIDISIPRTPIELMQQKCITRRFVFTASKISALRAKVVSTIVPNPTRVEAVSGILWKTAMTASRSRFGYSKHTIWSISVNMRKRFQPPLPKNYAGNCLGHIAMDGNCELELKEVVGRIRNEIKGFGENYVKKLKGDGALLEICGLAKDYGNLLTSNDIEFYICTSWCKYELYDADFGWGKPVWVSSASHKVRNVAVLMDTRDGDGIEVWLTLGEEDMAFFESNQDLLQFAAINPSIS